MRMNGHRQLQYTKENKNNIIKIKSEKYISHTYVYYIHIYKCVSQQRIRKHLNSQQGTSAQFNCILHIFKVRTVEIKVYTTKDINNE